MNIKDQIFRAYDIRGVYGLDLDEQVFEVIGKALGTYLGGEGKDVAVGYDVRVHSVPLKDALIRGLLSVGVNVRDVGLVPTPTVYFTISHYVLDGGAVVSASHNPPEWNGVKLCKEKGMLCGWGMGLEKIKDIAVEGRFEKAELGRLEDWRKKVLEDYHMFVVGKVRLTRRLRMLADMGNGSCSQFADRILRDAGLEVDAVNNFPDGAFPSRSPEPTDESLKGLKAEVVSGRYDFAVGYDGDGDRAVFIDDRGRIVEGDKMLAILIRHFIKASGEKVVYEVSCSKLLDDIVREKGVVPVISRVGHSFILKKMIEEDAIIGGEIASHLYFREVYGADDAIFATLKVAQMLSESNARLSELVDSLPKYFTKRKVFSVPEEIKFSAIEELKARYAREGLKATTIDGVRVDMDDGWFIVRASNTLPQIKATVEAKDRMALDRIENVVVNTLTEAVNQVRRRPRDEPIPSKDVNIT
ncbi:MAG: phosphomannomutase/phosphoglucomutase [Nitrososphaeria archaeon]